VLLNTALVVQILFVSVGMFSAVATVLRTGQPVNAVFLVLQVAVYLSWVCWSLASQPRNWQVGVANGFGVFSASVLLLCSWWVASTPAKVTTGAELSRASRNASAVSAVESHWRE
jgi:hypothetical protein